MGKWKEIFEGAVAELDNAPVAEVSRLVDEVNQDLHGMTACSLSVVRLHPGAFVIRVTSEGRLDDVLRFSLVQAQWPIQVARAYGEGAAIQLPLASVEAVRPLLEEVIRDVVARRHHEDKEKSASGLSSGFGPPSSFPSGFEKPKSWESTKARYGCPPAPDSDSR